MCWFSVLYAFVGEYSCSGGRLYYSGLGLVVFSVRTGKRFV